ncbi:MAG: VOC family protein [Paracoccaceae bacterium]|nr:MAG: VOC family protein [Paracoccaceae bacterium]
MTDAVTESAIMKGVIPYLGIPEADNAIAFYKTAFGAVLMGEIARDDHGLIMNATLVINGGALMLMDQMMGPDEPPARTGINNTLQLVVDDGDAWWDRAVAAGCTVTQSFKLEFWGDRYGRLRDPFGLDWAILEPSAAGADKVAG